MNIGNLLLRRRDEPGHGETTGEFSKRLSRKFRGGGLAIALGLALTAANPAVAQSWTELSPTGALPAVRIWATAAHNPANNRMIVFAGLIAVGSPLNDVWVLENADGSGGGTPPNWIQLSPTGGPPRARAGHSAVYDPGSNRMTVFAGNSNPGYCNVTLNDLWVLSNADGSSTPAWTQLSPSGGPPSRRYAHSAVYDPDTNRMIVFGGSPACGPGQPNNEVWILEDANGLGTPHWTQLSPTGGPPPLSMGHIAVYDPATNRMTVTSGRLGSDVWVLEDANGVGAPKWIQRSPTGGPPTIYGSGVYDPTTNQLITFGGVLLPDPYNRNEVWVLEDATGVGTPNWTQLSPTGGPPIGRANHTTVHIPGTGRMTVFGGDSNITGLVYNDVWVLSLGPDLEVAPAHVDFGDVAPFSSADMIVTVENVGAVPHVVEGISLAGIGAASFAVGPVVPPTLSLAPGDELDITVTYLPTGEGEETATLSIVTDEGTTEVSLVGNGLAGAVEDQVTVLESNVNESIAEGALIGSGSGGSAGGRLGAFANMVEAAGDLIEAGYIEDACGQLRSALKRVDGDPRPPDFVAGTDAELTAAEIVFLMESLGCN